MTNPMSIQAARDSQTVRIAVHPRGPLTVARDGETLILQPGEEVFATDFVGGSSVSLSLAQLVDHEQVVYLPDHQLRGRVLSSPARYVVARGGSLSTTNRGLVAEGEAVTPACFARGQLDIDELVERGAVVDRQSPPPGTDPAAA